MGKEFDREEKRAEIFADTFNYSIKQRHGLFSQPVSTAIGDTNKFIKKTANKDPETGKPLIEPRNFYTGPLMANQNKEKVHDSRYPSNAVGGPAIGLPESTINKYRQPDKPGLRTFEKDPFLAGGHDVFFRPTKAVIHEHRIAMAPYEYKVTKPPERKELKDPEGGVLTAPRNFYTNPMKKGKVGQRHDSIYFDGWIKWEKGDDYNAKKKLLQAEIAEHKEIIERIGNGKPFSQRARMPGLIPHETFNSIYQVYGLDRQMPKRTEKPKEQLEDLHGGAPMRPAGCKERARWRWTGIGQYPLHKPCPPKELERKVVDEDEGPRFKMTTNGLSRPTPSIATNMRNLKSSYPSAFKK